LVAASVPRQAPLDLLSPVRIDVEHVGIDGNHPVTMRLGRDEVEFEDSQRKHRFSIDRGKFVGITRANGGGNDEPKFVYETLRFTQKTKAGRNVVVRMSPANLFTLLRYLESTKPLADTP